MRTGSGPFARPGRAMRTAPEVMGRSSGSGCAAHRKLSPWKRRVYERELRTGPGSAAKGRAEVPERSTGSCAYGTQGLAEEFARWSAPKVVLKESGSGSENNRKLSRSNACDWPRKAGGGWAPEVTLRRGGSGGRSHRKSPRQQLGDWPASGSPSSRQPEASPERRSGSHADGAGPGGLR